MLRNGLCAFVQSDSALLVVASCDKADLYPLRMPVIMRIIRYELLRMVAYTNAIFPAHPTVPREANRLLQGRDLSPKCKCAGSAHHCVLAHQRITNRATATTNVHRGGLLPPFPVESFARKAPSPRVTGSNEGMNSEFSCTFLVAEWRGLGGVGAPPTTTPELPRLTYLSQKFRH